ncbi:MAG: 4Fe-4S dicluster domain-containing protein [Candidatus Sumerlaeia bacterium]|nr:4Fe-4S dicluster domain-containing protein [Candidatus Sumerlaeia bacterium]
MIKLRIDGNEVEVNAGTPLLKAAQKLNIEIPTLCYYEGIEPYAACRVCMVEVVRGRRRRMVTACNYPATDGIEVFTENERVRRARRLNLEMLLGRCSEVPVIRELAAKYGVEKSRFGYDPKEKCILCGLCVRMCSDIVKANVLSFAYSGPRRKVVTPFEREMATDVCIACGACAHVCPTGAITIEDLSQRRGEVPEMPLGPKTAISIPFQQAVPKVPYIDPDACIKMQTGGCGICAQVCEPEAINYTMQDEVVELDVGQILVATGYQIFEASQMAQYGYGKLDNVLSALEFEKMLNSTGPTGGRVLMKNGKEPRAIGLIHCIGSRDARYHKYCSRVCCMYALKFAHLVKDRTNAEVYQFYIDMRAFGKGYEEFYSRILDEGVNMIRGKAAEVVEATWGNEREGHLLVRCEDTLIGKFREVPVDMVVLCAAIEPNADQDRIGQIFSLSRSPDGFFLERHPKLDPMGTVNDGIYLAGCCQGPKDIPDTVAQAQGAAARILALISKGEVFLDPIRACIDENLCGGCKVCNNLCPYSAITFDDVKKVSIVNETLCKGCGTCVAACPAGAITGSGFTDEQIFAEIEGILADAGNK